MLIAVILYIILPSMALADKSLQPIANVSLNESPPPWEARSDVDPESYNNEDIASAVRSRSVNTASAQAASSHQVEATIKDEALVPNSTTEKMAAKAQPAIATSINDNSIEHWYEKRQQYQTKKDKSLADLRNRAVQGDVDAQYQLGVLLQKGIDGQAKTYEAINWLLKAANAGHGESQYALALIYQANQSNANDVKKSISWIQKAASNQVPEAQYYLGMMYAAGDQLKQDPKMAKQWFEKAEKQGHISAQIALAELRDRQSTADTPNKPSLAIAPSPQKQQIEPTKNKEILESESPLTLEGDAPLYPETATLQNQPIEVSEIAPSTSIVSEEPMESIEVASLSAPAINQSIPAQSSVLKQPVAVLEDSSNQKVKKHPTQPDLNNIMSDAKAGDMKAQLILGTLYEDGAGGLGQNYNEAIKWYRQSADQGYAKAQYNLGLLYEDGKGVKPDFYEAAQWYKRAANNGFAEAQNNLGVLYVMGKGVIRDKSKAELMFRKAAEQGNKNAARNLDMLLKEL